MKSLGFARFSRIEPEQNRCLNVAHPLSRSLCEATTYAISRHAAEFGLWPFAKPLINTPDYRRIAGYRRS